MVASACARGERRRSQEQRTRYVSVPLVGRVLFSTRPRQTPSRHDLKPVDVWPRCSFMLGVWGRSFVRLLRRQERLRMLPHAQRVRIEHEALTRLRRARCVLLLEVEASVGTSVLLAHAEAEQSDRDEE